MPPLLIAGLVGGAIYTYLNKENSNAKLQQKVSREFEKIRHQVKGILSERISDMEQNVSKTFDELDSQMAGFFLGGESIEQNSIVKNDLMNYSTDVQKLLLEWKQQKENIALQSNLEDIYK
ncbi:hypothetical protein SDC9_143455 [bioreactor metagenome]|uniref:Uncharacterized protein n=1 Tax=bioreactor metagenome TaxID=1076179 RepID=A0A645E3L1_9ZZZZ